MSKSPNSVVIAGPVPNREFLDAFADVDAVCRRTSNATGRQYLLRALSFLALDDRESYRADLVRALVADASDRDVLGLLLDEEPRIALAALAHPHASDALVRRAAQRLVAIDGLLLWAERTHSGLHGILAWGGSVVPELRVGQTVIDVAVGGERGRGDSLYLIHLWHPLSRDTAVRVSASLGPRTAAVDLPPTTSGRRRADTSNGVVTIVVPIYGGRDATNACLEALSTQTSGRPFEVILIDDDSPDAGLVGDVERLATDNGWTLLRNPTNVGFAASVNSAVRIARGDDVLVLNADAILPPGAIDRLLKAADHQSVGTVVPFSNDGGFTSFPTMRIANPVPSEAEAARIDEACRLSLSGPIDIPAGTAFCMLVTRSCWDALGGFDLSYRRGYFEDVDLCLRAKRRGFRNVLAPDLYVRHLGGQSFGADKQALVAENARLLIERFPDYDDEWMPFVDADPLYSLRGAIERRVPPTGPVRLIAGQGGESLASRLEENRGVKTLMLSSDREGIRRISGRDGGSPRSLAFARGERHAFRDYLRRLDITEIVVTDATEPLLDDLDFALKAEKTIAIALTGPRAHKVLRSGRRSIMRCRPFAVDGMGRSVLGLPTRPLPPPRAVRRGPIRVAAIAPKLSVRADRLIHALDRGLRPVGGEVVIFGAGLSRRARPSATGAIDEADYLKALVHRAISHVLLPDVETSFGIVERLRAICDLPAAYHDWSEGRHRPADGDLALAENLDIGDRVASLKAWCMPGFSAMGAIT